MASMSIKDGLAVLVNVQARELELKFIDSEIADVEQERAVARSEIEAAEGELDAIRVALEDVRSVAKRLDIDLKSAEEKVTKFNDQMLTVRTNQELWAIQEEIGHAERAVSVVETKILEQLEHEDSLKVSIGQKSNELAHVRESVDVAIAKANNREAELISVKAKVDDALSNLQERIPEDLMKKYGDIKMVRGGLGVAEILDEICLVCNFKMRPQLYADTFNFTDIMQCENCGRIVYVAERLGIVSAADSAQDDIAASNSDQPVDSEPAAAGDITS
jgi:hypothetical protein|tara:strand:- start:8723 stop:9550 length:828 start_codon:yes stop_codon:yes gene_type:complete